MVKNISGLGHFNFPFLGLKSNVPEGQILLLHYVVVMTAPEDPR